MVKTDQHIIKGCKNGDPQSQKLLYEKYKAMLFGICLRYAKDRMEAEDFLQEGFIRIYRDLYQFQPKSELGAWLRKVMVNCCLRQIQKNKLKFTDVDWSQFANQYEVTEEQSDLSKEKMLIKMIQQLPSGYRMIFNMYVMEGFTHQEIASYLDISVNTSKSQLSRAKTHLKKLYHKSINAY